MRGPPGAAACGLVLATVVAYEEIMRSPFRARVEKLARTVMVVAAVAFALQASVVIVEEAAAEHGHLPEAAVALGGPAHLHGGVAGFVHDHDGDEPGHVHDRAKAGDDGCIDGGTPCCSLAHTNAMMPQRIADPLPRDVRAARAPARDRWPTGIVPDGLSRPPSTPGIA
jgi:hypothetical protein